MAEPTFAEGLLRWWEFYVVRYAVPTVVGGIILYVLSRGDPRFEHITFASRDHLLYLAGLGFVYCYLASAPILVFHAGRFLVGELARKTVCWIVASGLLVGILTGIFVWCLTLTRSEQVPGTAYASFLVAAGIGVVIFLLQVLIVCYVVACECSRTQMWNFYKKLSDRRENANKGGLVDSYKHLREHGNAFAIVFLEVLLGVILIVTNAVGRGLLQCGRTLPYGDLAPLVVIIAVWILPSAFVWLIATQLERQFADARAPDNCRHSLTIDS